MKRILIIDDEIRLTRLLELELHREGYETVSVHDGVSAVREALNGSWDCILLDIMIPRISGFEVLSQVRKMISSPVLFLSAKSDPEDIIRGLDAGADDYIVKPFHTGELLARIRAALRRCEQQRKWKEISFQDPLTSLLNRRGWDASVPLILQAAVENSSRIGILAIDIDSFKEHNDRYGHEVGDRALTTVAESIRTTFSGIKALFCRIGGDEFAILTAGIEEEEVFSLAQKFSAAVTAAFQGGDKPLTVSIGIKTAVPQPETTVKELIHDADAALYRAKNNGKNQTVVCKRDSE